MTFEAIDAVRARLRARGADPRDIDLLVADATGQTRGWVLAHGDEMIESEPVDALVARRSAGEPLQYIRGRCDFFGREYLVDDRVLIPRPEAELLVETAIMRAPRNRVERPVLDAVDLFRRFLMGGDGGAIPRRRKTLDEIAGRNDLDASRANQFDRAGVDARHVRDGAVRRVLHGDPMQTLQQPPEPGFELAAARVAIGRAREMSQ